MRAMFINPRPETLSISLILVMGMGPIHPKTGPKGRPQRHVFKAQYKGDTRNHVLWDRKAAGEGSDISQRQLFSMPPL